MAYEYYYTVAEHGMEDINDLIEEATHEAIKVSLESREDESYKYPLIDPEVRLYEIKVIKDVAYVILETRWTQDLSETD